MRCTASLWSSDRPNPGALIDAVLGVVGLLPVSDLDMAVLGLAGRLPAVVAVAAAGALPWTRPGRFADGSRGAVVADPR
jgi:hypothetical protein